MLKKLTPFGSYVFCSVTVVFVLAAILFTSSGVAYAQNNVPRDAASKKNLKKFCTDLIPENVFGVVAFRPAQILTEDVMNPIRPIILKEFQQKLPVNFFGMMPTEIETMMTITFDPEPQKKINFVSVLQSTKAIDRKAAKKIFSTTELIEAKYKGKDYLIKASPSSDSLLSLGDALMFLNENTLVVAKYESALKDVIDVMTQSKANHWAKRMQSVQAASYAVCFDMRVVRKIAKEIVDDPEWRSMANLILNAHPKVFSTLYVDYILPFKSALPIWENAESMSLGLYIKEELDLDLTFIQEKNSVQVKQALESVPAIVRTVLKRLKETSQDNDQRVLPTHINWIAITEQFIQAAKVIRKNNQVTLTASLSREDTAELITKTLPVIRQSRGAARRLQSKKNLKKILLALHTYHEVHNHFPTAVVLGPDGKTPHSWRVELLPFLGQEALFKTYRFNEPWDSKNNKKVLSKMPAVFRYSKDEGTANNSSYYAVVGENTLFGNKAGLKMRDVTDGTRNTIAVVEAKRDIPWTKPEDIQYDGKKLPKLGGYFQDGYHVGLSDGGVQFFSENVDKDILKHLLEINDGDGEVLKNLIEQSRP